MKRILLIIAMLTVLLMAGCNKNEKIGEVGLQENGNNHKQEVIDNITIDEPNIIQENPDYSAKELFEKASRKIDIAQYTIDYSNEYGTAEPKEVNEGYIKSNSLYSDVEEEYAQFFTGEALNRIMNMRFKQINGYLYYSIAGATGWDAVKDVKVERVSETKNSITYKVKYSVPTENGAYNDECNMTITLTNDGYRVSLIDYREFMDSNDLKERKLSVNDLFGKWYISSAVNVKTAEKETNIEKIVGKQYSLDELFLELNSDGTFNDYFEKLINNNLNNNGTFEFFENFNRAHDSRVVLTYVDGNDKLTTIMYFEPEPDLSTPYIGYGFINGYDVYLKRM